MMCVSQIILPYTLNLYSTVCQLYLKKIGRKQNKTKKPCTERTEEEMCIFLSDKNKCSFHILDFHEIFMCLSHLILTKTMK